MAGSFRPEGAAKSEAKSSRVRLADERRSVGRVEEGSGSTAPAAMSTVIVAFNRELECEVWITNS